MQFPRFTTTGVPWFDGSQISIKRYCGLRICDCGSEIQIPQPEITNPKSPIGKPQSNNSDYRLFPRKF
jgi:hypothetical protein